jgi:hypothetical protein
MFSDIVALYVVSPPRVRLTASVYNGPEQQPEQQLLFEELIFLLLDLLKGDLLRSKLCVRLALSLSLPISLTLSLSLSLPPSLSLLPLLASLPPSPPVLPPSWPPLLLTLELGCLVRCVHSPCAAPGGIASAMQTSAHSAVPSARASLSKLHLQAARACAQRHSGPPRNQPPKQQPCAPLRIPASGTCGRTC